MSKPGFLPQLFAHCDSCNADYLYPPRNADDSRWVDYPEVTSGWYCAVCAQSIVKRAERAGDTATLGPWLCDYLKEITDGRYVQEEPDGNSKA